MTFSVWSTRPCLSCLIDHFPLLISCVQNWLPARGFNSEWRLMWHNVYLTWTKHHKKQWKQSKPKNPATKYIMALQVNIFLLAIYNLPPLLNWSCDCLWKKFPPPPSNVASNWNNSDWKERQPRDNIACGSGDAWTVSDKFGKLSH